MLKPCFAMSEPEAMAMVARTGVFRIAGATERGPLLRTVDGVVHDGMLCFHGADRGAKLELLGHEVMVAVEEVVAHLPSWFFDERRACPATTYYRSVHVWGVVERVVDLAAKAAVLQALMELHQPEGRHQPISAADPLYANVLDGLLVACIRPTRIVGKAKLGQHKGAATITRALDGLWRRGAPGDLEAIRAVRDAHPAHPTPSWMSGPAGVTFEVAPDEREVEAVVAMLEEQYWNEGVAPSRIRVAHLASPAWIVARDSSGAVVATARAVGDDAKVAILYDVAVRPEFRGRGVGRALISLLVQHPRVRGARRMLLRTRDAQRFYAKLGFTSYVPSNELLGRTTS